MFINGRNFSTPPRGIPARRAVAQPQEHTFPPPRQGVGPYGKAKAATRYERADASPLTTLADTNSELIRFSGRPDSITLSAQAFGALFVFQDFLGRTITELHVPAGGTQESYLAADRVSARNAVAGSNSIAQAVGKWAEPYESN